MEQDENRQNAPFLPCEPTRKKIKLSPQATGTQGNESIITLRGEPQIIKGRRINTDKHLTTTGQNVLVIPQEEENSVQVKGKMEAEDLYNPRITRGKGYRKEARCDVCESEGRSIWLRMKQSSYWYHMNFIHGINSQSGRPYELPTLYRNATISSVFCRSEDRFSTAKELQGLCEGCVNWITLECQALECLRTKGHIFQPVKFEGAENVVSHINFFNWYKHAQKCQNKKSV